MELATQLLPLLLALLGALIGAALGVHMGSHQVGWRSWCLSIAVFSGLAVTGIAYPICDGLAVQRKVQELGAIIRTEIDVASTIEYRAWEEGAAGAFGLARFVDQSEEWRNRNDEFLRRALPNSGADLRFRTGTGQVGTGAELYEYTRLTTVRANLMAVLDNLPSYVQRSH